MSANRRPLQVFNHPFRSRSIKVDQGRLSSTRFATKAPAGSAPLSEERCLRFRAKREIARLSAEIDPKPEEPARIEPVAPAAPRRMPMPAIAQAFVGSVRSLPEGDRPAAWIEPEQQAAAADGSDSVLPSSRMSADGVALADSEPTRELEEAQAPLENARLARQQARPERSRRFRVQFTAQQEYVDLIEEAFDLLGLGKRAASLPELQLRALREFVERLRQRRTGTKRPVREAARKTVSPRPPAAPAREAVTNLASAHRAGAGDRDLASAGRAGAGSCDLASAHRAG